MSNYIVDETIVKKHTINLIDYLKDNDIEHNLIRVSDNTNVLNIFSDGTNHTINLRWKILPPNTEIYITGFDWVMLELYYEMPTTTNITISDVRVLWVDDFDELDSVNLNLNDDENFQCRIMNTKRKKNNELNVPQGVINKFLKHKKHMVRMNRVGNYGLFL